MLDAKSGILTFANPPVHFGPGLTRAEFLSAAWANGATDLVVNEPWHSWNLPGEYASWKLQMVVSLFFHRETLRMVTLCDCDPKFGTSWNDWSEQKERDCKASHDRWLAHCVGRQTSFAWGNVSSQSDPRGGGSSITISYGNKP
jgi:hypothetical protein